MSSENRGRITVEQPGKPRLYQPADLPGWEVLGVVTRGDDKGALVRNVNTGTYAMANAGAIRSLDQRKVLAGLGQWANATKMQGGKRRNIYMSDSDADIAKKIGNGNISEGIRIALNALQSS